MRSFSIIFFIVIFVFIQKGIFAQQKIEKTVTYNLNYPDNSYPLNNALLSKLQSFLHEITKRRVSLFKAPLYLSIR